MRPVGGAAEDVLAQLEQIVLARIFEQLSQALTNKFLHDPMSALREATEEIGVRIDSIQTETRGAVNAIDAALPLLRALRELEDEINAALSGMSLDQIVSGVAVGAIYGLIAAGYLGSASFYVLAGRPVPPPVRPLFRRYVVPSVVDKYHDPRGVTPADSNSSVIAACSAPTWLIRAGSKPRSGRTNSTLPILKPSWKPLKKWAI